MDDVDIGSDDSYGRRQVWNAPAIPQPLSSKESTKSERRVFMREYQKYPKQINALQCTGSSPFAMPVGACMDPFSKRRIAMFDLNKDHNLVTEAEWIAWFHAAFEEDPQDLDVLKKRLSAAIRFDTKILDAESRVGRMLDDLMRVLEQYHQEWVLHLEGKMVVEVMARAIRPDTLKSAVQKQLQLQRNKALKSDVFRFVNWLRQFSAGFQFYVGLEEASPAPPKSYTTDKGGRGKGKDGGRGDGPKEGGGKNPPKIPLAAESDVAGDKGCAGRSAQRLLDAMVKNRQERVKVLADKSSRRSTNRGVMVEGVVRVENILLDTGADVNLVFPYGVTAAPLTVLRLATFGKLLSIRHDTASSIDDIISRPVMEVLGFSVDDLLVEARQQKSEWDVSDGIPASNMARCATPEVVVPKIIGASEESRRKTRDSDLAVLMAKADEAQGSGRDTVDKQHLTALLRKHVDVFREDLSDDPPVKVEPLKVRIKPDATPVKCGMRRYPPAHV
ncbi:hypothetical protein H310_12311 [Aphanomyces invadans]|uniref:Peptidase A2 domain-containing protein n=1 Tax=Aphanomyces invadans TaxID=157072 RepID=A0A024THU6_9STRA|nr:hypothetical protein H310_12311 [Aphanomyces invadans]ETV93735.1 hypothetical protein H310_12311 [Aphanomyces invadans]|eukprot:XP_008877544.1 hypothetical protein H310_12311 [Aphanomyces invadans]